MTAPEQTLAMLAAKAIQTAVFATDPTRTLGDVERHRLHRQAGEHMKELRAAMGDDWMLRECGWGKP